MLDYNYWSQIIIRVDYGERWVEWKKYEQQGDRDDVQEIPSSEHVLEKIKSYNSLGFKDNLEMEII